MLTQAVGYAITAMGLIAAGGGRQVLVREIAAAAEIPAPYLAKIIQTLARRGVVHTQRGVGGGVTLARPASEISLYDVCIALDDPIVRPTCLLGTNECSDSRGCPAHEFWSKIRGEVIAFLTRTHVSDIASFEQKRHRGQQTLLTISASQIGSLEHAALA